MRILPILVCFVVTMIAGLSAFGQSLSGMNTGMAGAVKPPTAGKPDASQPPPPALPGSKLHQAGPAPANKLPTDLAPNEALFDAINRGDTASARDAINRGADLRARNVLGMTPLELSVDLNRNDISFLLLSMRGEEGDATHPPPPSVEAPLSTPSVLARPDHSGRRAASSAAEN